ncbi:MAG: DUF222 domain-containing protein, partial [Acidimicrobiia bacterium]|nr:DUF222 domain-containing protein [Acidimicrobiia bacterium]
MFDSVYASVEDSTFPDSWDDGSWLEVVDDPVDVTGDGDTSCGLVGLDRLEPGPAVAAAVASIDPSAVSGHEQVVLLRALQRTISHLQARLYATMTAIVDTVATSDDLGCEYPEQAAAAEIAAALCLTRRAADTELSMALDLDRRLPQVGDALERGHLDRRRAGALLHGTAHLTPAIASSVVDAILDDAGELTTGQISHRLRRLCIDVAPDDAHYRFEHATAQRRVVAQPEPDGTTTLYAPGLSPDRAAAAMNRVNTIAKSLRGPGETRSMDQLRADVLVDLLAGTGDPTWAGRGTVDIHTTLTTLTGLSDTPGELAGYGPVIAEITRNVAKRQTNTKWQATVVDEETNTIIATMALRRRPTAAEQREVRARYPECVWPGCRMPATQSDLDHRTPHADHGPTNPTNLAPLCRHHHTIRHQHHWHYTRTTNG